MESLLPPTKGIGRSGAVRDAAKEAIDHIQGRLQGAGQGQFSITSPSRESGNLAIADAPGTLSEPTAQHAEPGKITEEACGEGGG